MSAAAVEGALAARGRLRHRPLRETIVALTAAAARWVTDATLAAELPAAARLTPAMTSTILPIAARALDADVMTGILEGEYESGSAEQPPPDGPALVAHVLASNVPALALPAIALGCLAGAAVVIKSGRQDTLSAPAFARALAAVDRELAETVVTVYWPGGTGGTEEAVLARADVVLASGGDVALAALARRVGRRLVAFGPRWSVAAVVDPGEAEAQALALDVALYEQRGCLSPHLIYVVGDARGFAERLAAALDTVADRLPPVPLDVSERAALRLFREAAECLPDAAVWVGRGGTVVYEPEPAACPGPGLRGVRVHPLASLGELPELLPVGTVECVAIGGADPKSLGASLRARGVARLCRPGRMQQPRLSWPRGQQRPLAALRRRPHAPLLEVEA